jgi:hypothetical protein
VKGNAGARRERRQLHEGGSEMRFPFRCPLMRIGMAHVGRRRKPGCSQTVGGGGSAVTAAGMSTVLVFGRDLGSLRAVVRSAH